MPQHGAASFISVLKPARQHMQEQKSQTDRKAQKAGFGAHQKHTDAIDKGEYRQNGKN